mmetsp:Transcript_18858/g.35184  ORF Transcript_18858/g.35184 Transcript_18858/m.35184 type:complete len:219 (-) Transcript_18858:163-819(-)
MLNQIRCLLLTISSHKIRTFTLYIHALLQIKSILEMKVVSVIAAIAVPLAAAQIRGNTGVSKQGNSLNEPEQVYLLRHHNNESPMNDVQRRLGVGYDSEDMHMMDGKGSKSSSGKGIKSGGEGSSGKGSSSGKGTKNGEGSSGKGSSDKDSKGSSGKGTKSGKGSSGKESKGSNGKGGKSGKTSKDKKPKTGDNKSSKKMTKGGESSTKSKGKGSKRD